MMPTDFLAQQGSTTTRRRFVQIMAGAGGALVLGVPLGAAAQPTQGSVPWKANAFLRIATDGAITMIVPYVEMGQGTYTSIPMLIAEELDIDLTAVRVEHAPPDDKAYANPLLGFQVTGGSTTIRAVFLPIRTAAATARHQLVEAAARRWGVEAAACRTESGNVVHTASGRRAGYGNLATDAALLVPPPKVTLKTSAQFRIIGRRANRLDTPAKINGTATYGIDVRLPGMVVATLAQSPVFGGRLTEVDDSAARAVRGVRQVVRLPDAVAVVADHMGAAKKGLAALKLQWDDGPNAKVSSESIRADMARAASAGGVKVRSEGDVEAALRNAVHRLEATYELPFLIHATMEPMNCTVHVQRDRCDVWVGTQVITRVQAAAAELTGLPLEKVTVHNQLLGGGFGRRLEVDTVVRAVQIAQQVKGPVKVVWTREEDVQHDMYKPAFYDTVRAGLDAQGRVTAWHHRLTGSSVIKRWAPPLYQNGFEPEVVDGAAEPPYVFANLLVEYQNHEPPVPTSFWRGVGPAHNVFVVEGFMDELAAAAGSDPLAYRAAALAHDPRALGVLREAAKAAGWGQPLEARSGRGIAVQYVFGTYLAAVVEVAVDAAGEVTVRRITAAVDAGQVVNPDTVVAQIEGGLLFGMSAALWTQATIRAGRVEQSNFHDVRVVRMNETPKMQTLLLPSTEAPGGIGEPGTAIFAPALVNAVFAATGRRVRRLPVDSQALKQT
ncbi:MAG: molybdopterin cofactor-binding domain-containing protein [Ottowia sp.]|uniref:xanthine dehydrogenase family protein molybdopterin-binding subunit n=1 Tax=Ottowia sp. TaxID=1898956 RepID=UPI003C71F89E